LEVAAGIVASEDARGVGTASGTEAGEVALGGCMASGPEVAPAVAGPAAGSCGKSSAGAGKGSACVAWSDWRLPDRGKGGSSSVAAATAGTVVLAESVEAGAVACAGSEVFVDVGC
jgi:hypothetical protein